MEQSRITLKKQITKPYKNLLIAGILCCAGIIGTAFYIVDDGDDVVIYKHMTFVEFEKIQDNSDFRFAHFEDQSGNAHKFISHKVYDNTFNEGWYYDLGIDELDFMRPDNEIVQVDPFKESNFK